MPVDLTLGAGPITLLGLPLMPKTFFDENVLLRNARPEVDCSLCAPLLCRSTASLLCRHKYNSNAEGNPKRRHWSHRNLPKFARV